MPLNFSRVATQIQYMATTLKADQQNRESRLVLAIDTLKKQSTSIESLMRKLEISKTSWLVAGLIDGLSEHFQPPPCPADYTAIASDGSHIDIDRHSPAKCFLINLGSIVLSYGQNPSAILSSHPALYALEEDMTIVDPLGSSEQPVQGGLLGIKRAVSECVSLGEIANDISSILPTIALLDGSLILWELAGRAYPDYVKQALLQNGFLPALDQLSVIGENTLLALISYISAPRSTEVVNLLRVAICPYDPPDCDKHCPRNTSSSNRECEVINSIHDSDIFSSLLRPGERSSTFISRSSVVVEHYREHEVRFFYLKTEEEIARVEFPRWVEERGLIEHVHAMVLDQCLRGHGYPVALSEAHEQAVVNSADREQFRHLVELALDENHLSTSTSAKSRSKRTRWV